jgi:signal transduction histidine kinase
LIVALLAVVALGIPLGILGMRLVRGEAKNRVEHEAATLALALEEALEQDHLMTRTDVEQVLHDDREATLTLPDGREIHAGSDVGSQPVVGSVAAPGGTSVIVRAPREESNDQVFRVWLAVVGASGFALTTAVVLALLEARRLSTPLHELARTSARLGHGDFSAHADAGNVPEMIAVADALNSSAERIASLVAREREFTTNASHQLRTSLTGIRIRIESAQAAATLDPVVERELTRALEQCDRLTGVIEDLLAFARARRAGEEEEISVRDLVERQAEAWRVSTEHLTRDLMVHVATSATVRVGRGPIEQALDVLIDNSLKHGAGAVRIAARDVGTRYVSIEVGDEGPGIAPGAEGALFERSSAGDSGVGLSLARGLVRSEGGRLDLVEARPPLFAIYLERSSPNETEVPIPQLEANV